MTNINTLLAWSEPKPIQTKAGIKLLRKAILPPGCDFWKVWKAEKSELKEAGVSVSNYQGTWEACWWLPLNPEADAEAKLKSKQEEQERAMFREHESADLELVYEERLKLLLAKLIPYQVPSVRRLVHALVTEKGALDASDTGTGKTFVALAVAKILQRPVYVVCPKAVIPSWKRAADYYDVACEAINYEKLRRGTEHAVSLVDNDKDVQWELDPANLIIFDECHRMKSYTTWNCALGLAAVRQGYSVLGLSATAADNPLQMKFIGVLCRLFAGEKQFWQWCSANQCSKGRWGMEFVGGRKTLEKIHASIFPLHGTRIRIADLGDAFPESQISAECYDMNGSSSEIQAIYDDMENEIARLEAKEDVDSTRQACILTTMLRARQRSELLKVPAIAAMAEDARKEGMSVAIFCNFDETVEALMIKLKTDCVIRGGQSAEEREANRLSFQSIRQARLSIICPTWSGQDMKQALGRVRRATVKDAEPVISKSPSSIIICNIRAGGVGISLHDEGGSKSIQRIFFAAGTIEERVCEQVKEKIARIDILNDGSLLDSDLSLHAKHAVIDFEALTASKPVPPVLAVTGAIPPIITKGTL